MLRHSLDGRGRAAREFCHVTRTPQKSRTLPVLALYLAAEKLGLLSAPAKRQPDGLPLVKWVEG